MTWCLIGPQSPHENENGGTKETCDENRFSSQIMHNFSVQRFFSITLYLYYYSVFFLFFLPPTSVAHMRALHSASLCVQCAQTGSPTLFPSCHGRKAGEQVTDKIINNELSGSGSGINATAHVLRSACVF